MQEISAKKYILSNAITSMIRVGASTLATLVLVPFIIKHIGIDNYSYVSMTAFFVSFASLFDLGLTKTLVYLLNDKNKNDLEKSQIITTQKFLNVTMCLGALFVGVVLIIAKVNILGSTLPFTDPHYYPVVISSLLILCVTLYSQYQMALLESQFLLQKVNMGTTVKIMSMNVLYFLNLITKNDIYFYIISALAASIIGSLYYEFIIKKYLNYTYIRPNKVIAKEVFTNAFGFMKLGVLTSVYASLPRIIIFYLSPVIAYVGILDVINKITMSIIHLCSSILQPIFSLSRKSPEKIRSNFKKIQIFNIITGLCFLFVIIVLNDQITNYFFHDKSIDNIFIGRILIIYSLSSVFYLCSQPCSLYLMGVGKNNKIINTLIINIVFMLTLYVLVNSIFKIDVLLNLSIVNVSVSIIYFVILNYFIYGVGNRWK